MDDTEHPDRFPPLTFEQIQGVVESIQDAFGNEFSRAVFTNHLLVLFEDVPGRVTRRDATALPAWTDCCYAGGVRDVCQRSCRVASRALL
ncbi:hypothetical protein C0Z18_25410 [Trinickia dabaoshanensis]|uniref:Uncharacterized protein n=1 Tax=Trinickia dabaoshanensis TaxID=564714 RepID=A0A2N7VF95_9BURK|nr:hypothetical protein C0Z18_25410 [Trinickia dabaoshanensis]